MTDEIKPWKPLTTFICEACELKKPLDEFLMMESELDPTAPSPHVCDMCRRYGKPVTENTRGLTPRWRRVMEILATGGTITDACKATKINKTTIQRMLDGEENKHVRAAFNRLLVDHGFTPGLMATVLREAADALKHQWNPEEREFNAFPDHNSRLNAVRHVSKIMALEAPKERAQETTGQGVHVTVTTNLGNKEKDITSDAYIVEVSSDAE